MKNDLIIGVDIGGTNTDAVLVDHSEKILAAVKTTTTDNISHGFKATLNQLLKKVHICPSQIAGVVVGTTQATNAILELKSLYRVGVIRIAGHRPDCLPVAFSWPKPIKASVLAGTVTIGGGFECHGGFLTKGCKNEAREAIETLLNMHVDSIAIIGVFSPLNNVQEKEVAHLVTEIAGIDFPISLSYEIGGIGFIERENSTILNAALKRVMKKGFHSLKAACLEIGIQSQLMVTQNDGSLVDVAKAIEYPVLTISAGPTNSFIGGSRLAEKKTAVVVDIGGTSTDAGLVMGGFPIRSMNTSNIGGVLLNFSMPNVLSVALGGGSLINMDNQSISIGPSSIAKELNTHSVCFGGDRLTLTDVALSMGYIEIPEANQKLIHLCPQIGHSIMNEVKSKIQGLVSKTQGEYRDLPVVMVGGGSALFPPNLFDSSYQAPPYYNVANAYGAALAEISGKMDTVVDLEKRAEVMENLYDQAKQKAIDQGADASSLRLVDQQIISYSYLPNQMARVIVRFCGKRRV